jgi:hypothetical protein
MRVRHIFDRILPGMRPAGMRVGDHSGLFRGRRLCDACLLAAQEAERHAIESARLTIPQFLAAAAAAGNPEIRCWRVGTVTSAPVTERRGLRRKTTYRTEVTVERELHGWILEPGGTGHENALMLDLSGSIHRADRTTGDSDYPQGGPVLTHDWASSDFLPTERVMYDWATGSVGTTNYGNSERLDQMLRRLAAKIEVSL